MVAGRRTYAGLFLVTLATLLDEILLTRIFSVATWYHFAFLAISIAMLGMTLGAVAVAVFGRAFAEERTRRHLALSALLFASTLGLGFLVQVRIPFATELTAGALLGNAAIFLLATVPFACSGVCVCLALTRFPRQVGRLYAADLAGAAIACVAVIYFLKITDGPTAVIGAAAIAAAGSIGFALEAGDARLVRAAIATAAVLSGAAAVHTVLVWNQRPIVRLRSVKGTVEERPLYEAWNSFSRIRVRPSPTQSPLGWGLSQVYRPRHDLRQLILDIDGGASTVLTGFDGDLEFFPEEEIAECYFVGFDNDISRTTFSPPLQDRIGLGDTFRFGSPHTGGCNFVLGDGSVRTITYSVNPAAYKNLGNIRSTAVFNAP